jgi:hypothetical protein
MSLKSGFSKGIPHERPRVESQLPHHPQALGWRERTPVIVGLMLFPETSKDSPRNILARFHCPLFYPSRQKEPSSRKGTLLHTKLALQIPLTDQVSRQYRIEGLKVETLNDIAGVPIRTVCGIQEPYVNSLISAGCLI